MEVVEFAGSFLLLVLKLFYINDTHPGRPGNENNFLGVKFPISMNALKLSIRF